MTNEELVKRVRDVLRAMTVLSEAGTAKMDGDRISGSGTKSQPPKGVRFGRRDLRDLSLADYWDDRFKRAKGDVDKIHIFLYLAERDLARARRRQPIRDPHETREEREARIIDQYEGLTPIEAALAEDCTEAWIRRVRLDNGRDPGSGAHGAEGSGVPAERAQRRVA